MEITNQVGIAIPGELVRVKAGIDTDFEQDWKLNFIQSSVFYRGGGKLRISVLDHKLKSLNNENDEAGKIDKSKYFFFSSHSSTSSSLLLFLHVEYSVFCFQTIGLHTTLENAANYNNNKVDIIRFLHNNKNVRKIPLTRSQVV